MTTVLTLHGEPLEERISKMTDSDLALALKEWTEEDRANSEALRDLRFKERRYYQAINCAKDELARRAISGAS